MKEVAFLSVIAAIAAGCDPMDCGKGVSLCGVLGVTSGLSGEVAVNGLLITTGKFGTSECVRPKNVTMSGAKSCVQNQEEVWQRQGMCSGTKSAEDYFSQACNLAQKPKEIVSSLRADTIEDAASGLTEAGYEVFSVDPQKDMITLTACATIDGVWTLAPMSQFPSICGLDSQFPSANFESGASTLM